MCVIKTRVSVNISYVKTLYFILKIKNYIIPFTWMFTWFKRIYFKGRRNMSYEWDPVNYHGWPKWPSLIQTKLPFFPTPIALLFPGIYQYIPLSINNISLLFTNYEFVPHLTRLWFVYNYKSYHMLLILL